MKDFLDSITEKQVTLIQTYQAHGYTLPDLSLPHDHDGVIKFCNGLCSEIIEELSELYDEVTLVMAHIEETTSDIDSLYKLLENVGMEVADAMHFLQELNIYGDFTPALQIETLVEKYGEDHSSLMSAKKPLSSYIEVARYLCISEGDLEGSAFQNLIAHYGVETSSLPFQRKAGSYMTYSRLNAITLQIFTCMRSAISVRRVMKSKYWSEKNHTPNTDHLHLMLFNLNIEFYKLCCLLNLEPESLYLCYITKNDINLNRIKDNY